MTLHTVQNIDVGASLNETLASPKSQILSLQLAFASIFLGLRSLWYTLAATKHKLFRSSLKPNLTAITKSTENEYPVLTMRKKQRPAHTGMHILQRT